MYGKKVWIFPDAELPPEGVNCIPGHESVIITNVCEQAANVTVTVSPKTETSLPSLGFSIDEIPPPDSVVQAIARMAAIIDAILIIVVCFLSNFFSCQKILVSLLK